MSLPFVKLAIHIYSSQEDKMNGKFSSNRRITKPKAKKKQKISQKRKTTK
jgi:hypothetical protein